MCSSLWREALVYFDHFHSLPHIRIGLLFAFFFHDLTKTRVTLITAYTRIYDNDDFVTLSHLHRLFF